MFITDEEYPTIKISRKYGELKGTYFGPFIPAKTARAMKELIHKLFKLRTCDPMPTRNLVCFDYHLGLCSGPCAGKISKKDYQFEGYYSQGNLVPKKILLNRKIKDIDSLKKWLKEFKKTDVEIEKNIPEEIIRFVKRNLSYKDLSGLKKVFLEVIGIELPDPAKTYFNRWWKRTVKTRISCKGCPWTKGFTDFFYSKKRRDFIYR